MPVIDRIGAFRVLFYANDHEPMHVHVIVKGRDRGAKILLEKVTLSRNRYLTAQEIKQALEIVSDNRQKYMEAWNEFFGG